VAVFRLEPLREAILWHPRGTLLRDTFRRLSEVIAGAAQLARAWNASAARFRGPQPDDEATSNLKSALLVVNAAWAAFADAFDRLPARINETPATNTNIAARVQIVISHPVIKELPGSGFGVIPV
jgi:hypothetical protein